MLWVGVYWFPLIWGLWFWKMFLWVDVVSWLWLYGRMIVWFINRCFGLFYWLVVRFGEWTMLLLFINWVPRLVLVGILVWSLWSMRMFSLCISIRRNRIWFDLWTRVKFLRNILCWVVVFFFVWLSMMLLKVSWCGNTLWVICWMIFKRLWVWFFFLMGL